MLGIDEAGRGPVLGPMVYGACYTTMDNETELAKLGFAGQRAMSIVSFSSSICLHLVIP